MIKPINKILLLILIPFSIILSQQTVKDSLANELIKVAKVKDIYEQTTAQTLLENYTLYNDYNQFVLDFYFENFSFDTFKDDYAEVYKSEFTQNELQDLIDFYKSETGQKFQRRLPLISAKISRLIEDKFVEKQPILDSLLEIKLLEIVRDTSIEFGSITYEEFFDSTDFMQPSDTVEIAELNESDCYKFREGKFKIEGDTSGYYIIRKDNIQREVYDFFNSEYVLNVEWISDCEYNLIFVRQKNKKFRLYETEEVINVKIISIEEDIYTCIVHARGDDRLVTLVKLE